MVQACEFVCPISCFKAGFHFIRIVPKRIVFLCFLSTRVELMFRYVTIRLKWKPAFSRWDRNKCMYACMMYLFLVYLYLTPFSPWINIWKLTFLILIAFSTLNKTHGLETRRKHNTPHYVCWGRFMQKYGSYLVTCILYLLRINQW